jgi:hypothetical protein
MQIYVAGLVSPAFVNANVSKVYLHDQILVNRSAIGQKGKR